MKKVHLLFLENSNGQTMEELRNHLPFNKMYINKNNKRYMLYGMTTDKSLATRFLLERSREFISIKENYEDIPKVVLDHENEYKLIIHKYSDGKKKHKILGPVFEYHTIRHYWDNLIEPTEYFNAIDIAILSAMKPKYLRALYKIGFLQLFILSTGTEDNNWYTAAEQDVETGHYIFVENEFPFLKMSESDMPEKFIEIGANEFNLFMKWYKYTYDLDGK